MNPNATAYVDCCELCLGMLDERGTVIGHRQATVQGTLRIEADVGFATCRRGHRLVIRRIARPIVVLSRA